MTLRELERALPKLERALFDGTISDEKFFEMFWRYTMYQGVKDKEYFSPLNSLELKKRVRRIRRFGKLVESIERSRPAVMEMVKQYMLKQLKSANLDLGFLKRES